MTRTLRLAVLPLAAGLLAWAPTAGAQDRAVRRQSGGGSTRAVAAPASRPSPPPSRIARTPSPSRAVPRARAVTRATSPASARPSTARAAEQRRGQTASPRQGRSGGGERAVPRGSSQPDRGRAATGSRRATGGDRVTTRGRAASGGRNTTDRAVDRSRDRGDRPSYGVAVPRTSPRPPSGGSGRGYYPIFPGYSYPWWRYSAPAGFGLFYWDPYWWGGYPYYGGYGSYYGSYYGGGYYSGPSSAYYGQLRLKVDPREAEVFVDGYFAGHVDDYDGIFQRLNLDVGPHRIEIRHPGYEPITFEVRIQPDQTITYEADMIEK